ncbi:NtaA/DmoA family FMN-dependent monooxygenase [Frankia tisae]|uniref:NtaA/DmoA family FMN-dependent monooxygenase n=1 Tax=Frankia tisae TaxID=2950104 RepID=UPI0021BFF19B|nr:NtaA/DmoA family FMN-dependent monooxygenase [Frankia tisae]
MGQQRTLHLAAHAVGLAPAFSQESDPIRQKYDLAAIIEATRLLEDAKFDAVFEADAVIFDIDDADSIYTNLHADATAVAAALAAATSKIGLVSTATTTFNVPYALARQFQSIDQLSGGRLGWNAVTSFGGEKQFGFDELPDQTIRYQRAVEFVDIVQGLWRGWHADAVSTGSAKKPRIDSSKIDRFTYEGEFLRTDGALGIPRSPQGWPVQWQAGASAEGLRFAGRYAEAIFSASPDLDHALGFRNRLAAAVAEQRGSDAPAPLVFPGVHLIAASTEVEAKEQGQALIDALDVEAGRRSLALAFGAVVAAEREGPTGIELSDLDLDEPIPAERLDALPDSESLRRRRSRSELYRGLARKGLTLRQLIIEHLQGHAHYRLTGSFEQVADDLGLWFDEGGADGFVLRFSNGAEGLHGFIEHVIPRLQDRGLFRRDYAGSTLREHLGLPIPA